MNKRRTSRREQKNKRLHRVKLQEQKIVQTLDDNSAEREGIAIAKHHRQVIHAPRINFTYRIGDYVIPSGKKHRKIG
jgi:hypothetical protein